MLNFVLFSATFIFSISICRFTFVTSGLNSCLNTFDFTSVQTTIVVPFETGAAPYFDEKEFIGCVYKHFTANLNRYLTPYDKYEIKFFFSDNGSYMKDAKKEKGRMYEAGFAFYCNYLGFARFEQEKVFAIAAGSTYEG